MGSQGNWEYHNLLRPGEGGSKRGYAASSYYGREPRNVGNAERSLGSMASYAEDTNWSMMRQAGLGPSSGQARFDPYENYYRQGPDAVEAARNFRENPQSLVSYRDEQRHSRRWDNPSQDIRIYSNQRASGAYPSFAQQVPGYLSDFSGPTNALGNAERSHVHAWNNQPSEVPSLEYSYPQQHRPQTRRGTLQQTLQQGDYSSASFVPQRTYFQEPQVPLAAPEPSIGAQVPRLSERNIVHHSNHPSTSFMTTPSEAASYPADFRTAQLLAGIQSPQTPRLAHADLAVDPQNTRPTESPAHPDNYISPFSPRWHPRLLLSETQKRELDKAYREFVDWVDNNQVKVDAIVREFESRKLAKMEEDNKAAAAAPENKPSTPSQPSPASAPANPLQESSTGFLPGQGQQAGSEQMDGFTYEEWYNIMDHSFTTQHGREADMVFSESATGRQDELDPLTHQEQQKQEAERVARHREERFVHVQRACARMTGAFGMANRMISPLPENPMHPTPGGNARQAVPDPPVIEPLGLKNYEDLRSCLLEWGSRGGMATLPLQRVTFFRASARQETGRAAPMPSQDEEFRIHDIKMLFAEDGLLTVNAVNIPDKHGAPKEWIWLELKQPLAEIHGNMPAEFQDRPQVWMIMALPSQHAYFYAWHDAGVSDKAEAMKGLGGFDSEHYAGLSRAPPGAATYIVWSSGGLPSMQFSPKPKFVSDLLQGSSQEFLGIPFIGPYPQVEDPTSPMANDEARNWWNILGTAMSRDADRWLYIQDLMKKGLLGIELRATKQAFHEWDRSRAMLATRQWTHSPAAGPLEEFRPLVDPKPTPSTGHQYDPKRPSGLRNEILADSPEADPTSSGASTIRADPEKRTLEESPSVGYQSRKKQNSTLQE